MANPQKENGYTIIANEIIEALVKYRIPGEQMQCLLFILRKTYGYNKIWDTISNSQFVENTGIKKPNVCRAIKGLVDKKLVIKKDNKRIPSYRFNKNYDIWKPLSKKITVIKSDILVLLKKIPTKDITTKDIYSGEFKFKIKVPIPDDIILTDRMKKYVIKQGCNNGKHSENLFEDFKNHFHKSGKKWQDWTATFYTWVRNDKKLYNPDKYKTWEDVPTERG